MAECSKCSDYRSRCWFITVVAILVLFVGTVFHQVIKETAVFTAVEEQKKKQCGEPESAVEKEIKLCLDKGGVPVRSGWTGMLKDCVFKDRQ